MMCSDRVNKNEVEKIVYVGYCSTYYKKYSLVRQSQCCSYLYRLCVCAVDVETEIASALEKSRVGKEE